MDDETRVLLTKIRNWIKMGKNPAEEKDLIKEIDNALELDSIEEGVQAANETFKKILEKADG